MAMKNVVQGDKYNLSMNLYMNGESLTEDDLSEVEVTIEGLTEKKTLTGGDVTYSDDRWWFPLTQEDTFSLKGRCDVEIRIKLAASGEIYGKIIEGINFQEGLSNEFI